MVWTDVLWLVEMINHQTVRVTREIKKKKRSRLPGCCSLLPAPTRICADVCVILALI